MYNIRVREGVGFPVIKAEFQVQFTLVLKQLYFLRVDVVHSLKSACVFVPYRKDKGVIVELVLSRRPVVEFVRSSQRVRLILQNVVKRAALHILQFSVAFSDMSRLYSCRPAGERMNSGADGVYLPGVAGKRYKIRLVGIEELVFGIAVKGLRLSAEDSLKKSSSFFHFLTPRYT